MADSTTFNQPVAPKPVARPRPASRAKSRVLQAGNFTLWVGLLAGAVLALAPIAQFSLHEIETAALTHADAAFDVG
jgi:hypothetical protein